MSEEQEIDVLSVGDVVIDAFVKLLDDQARVDDENGYKRLNMPYGTKIPFDFAEVVNAVGNASNAAVSFAKLGLKSALYANVGNDQWGRDIIASLHEKNVDSRFVKVQAGKLSNYHYVLWYKDDRTILIKHEEYQYHWPQLHPDEIPKWIYFSSISKNAIPFHDKVVEWLEAHPDTKLAFQPGTFQMDAGTERLKGIYQHTEVLIVNREEAAFVGGGNHEDIHDLFNKLHELGPRIVVITDGPNGSYASEGEVRWRMPNYPDPAPPYERTGAGDSFASTFVAALIHGSNVEGALQWAPINAMSVVQGVGAQKGLLDQKQMNDLLEKAPDWYQPERL